MKRKFSIILALIMVFSLVLTGCSSKGEQPQGDGDVQTDGEETFKVGINNFGQANFFCKNR